MPAVRTSARRRLGMSKSQAEWIQARKTRRTAGACSSASRPVWPMNGHYS